MSRKYKPVVNVRPGEVELTPNGIRYSRSRPLVSATKGGGKRGKVQGFSRAAARRFRELLFRCDFHPKGMTVVGVCLTLPREAFPGVGEVIWSQMRTHCKHLPGLVALVWRKELQGNGREHFHAVVWSDDTSSLRTVGALVKTWCRLVAKRCSNPKQTERRMLKAHCKGKAGLFDAVLLPSTGDTSLSKLIDAIPCLSAVDAIGKGVQYLIDHTSRYKRHQAKTTGRVYGVWNRKRLPMLPPEASRYVSLERPEEYATRRLLQRLTRFPMKVRCDFGTKMSRGRRFARGSQIIPSTGIRDAVGRLLESRGVDLT